MFHISNVKNKYSLLLAMVLMVPYLFRTTQLWDSYWEEYYLASNSGIDTIAYLFIFGALIARSTYVQKSLLGLASIWAITNFIPYSFDEWNNGNFESFLAIILYAAGTALLGKVTFEESALINFQLESFVARIQGSAHKLFSIIWVIIAAIASIAAAWLQFNSYGEVNLYTLISTLAVFLTSVAVFDFIHRFFEENREALANFTSSLNDFSLNSYMTRRISSVLYGLFHTFILVGTVYILPTTITEFDSQFWILLLGFPLLLPVALLGAYLVIMLVRLVFEYTNALIHVAENTSK
jgi:hypothetical protein